MSTGAAASGRFRALYCEMIPDGPELLATAVGPDPVTIDTPVGVKYDVQFREERKVRTASPSSNGKSRPPSSAYTGDACDVCGSFSVRRTGPCVTCDDCGTNSGCG